MTKSMKDFLVIFLGILIFLVVITVSVAIFTFNRINYVISLDESVRSSWAQVENVLKRRMDLIPNYVEIVKGYAAHEKDVFVTVTEARSKVAGAGSVKEKIQANQELSTALGRLLVVVERYPELKANQNFIMLQDELAGTENRIAVERRRYNETVRTYNTYIRGIPGRFIAGILKLSPAPYYEVEPEAKQAPKISF